MKTQGVQDAYGTTMLMRDICRNFKSLDTHAACITRTTMSETGHEAYIMQVASYDIDMCLESSRAHRQAESASTG